MRGNGRSRRRFVEVGAQIVPQSRGSAGASGPRRTPARSGRFCCAPDTARPPDAPKSAAGIARQPTPSPLVSRLELSGPGSRAANEHGAPRRGRPERAGRRGARRDGAPRRGTGTPRTRRQARRAAPVRPRGHARAIRRPSIRPPAAALWAGLRDRRRTPKSTIRGICGKTAQNGGLLYTLGEARTKHP